MIFGRLFFLQTKTTSTGYFDTTNIVNYFLYVNRISDFVCLCIIWGHRDTAYRDCPLSPLPKKIKKIEGNPPYESASLVLPLPVPLER